MKTAVISAGILLDPHKYLLSNDVGYRIVFLKESSCAFLREGALLCALICLTVIAAASTEQKQELKPLQSVYFSGLMQVFYQKFQTCAFTRLGQRLTVSALWK